MNRPICEPTGKVCFYSKHDARNALTGHLGKKSMRVYRCEDSPSHFHVTRMWKKKYEKKRRSQQEQPQP
jgi:hypothetical protein